MKKWTETILALVVVVFLAGLFWFHIHDIWRAATYRFHEATVDFATGDVEYRFFGFTRGQHSFPDDVRQFLVENSLDLAKSQRFVSYRPGNHPEKVYPDYRGMRMARNSLWKIAAWRDHDPEITGRALRLYQEERLFGVDHQQVWAFFALGASWDPQSQTYLPNPFLDETEISERIREIEQIGDANSVKPRRQSESN